MVAIVSTGVPADNWRETAEGKLGGLSQLGEAPIKIIFVRRARLIVSLERVTTLYHNQHLPKGRLVWLRLRLGVGTFCPFHLSYTHYTRVNNNLNSNRRLEKTKNLFLKGKCHGYPFRCIYDLF